MRNIKTLGLAGALVASSLVGGTLISSALAAPAGSSPATVANANGVDSEYTDVFLDALAAELGVDRAALADAASVAATAAIDAALEAGDISEARATALKGEIADMEDAGLLLRGHFGIGGPGTHGGPGLGFGGGDVAEAAATALGIDTDALMSALRDADSLQDVAEAQGVSYDDVSAAVTAVVTDKLDAAVADGEITQAQADDRLAGLASWLADGGSAPERGFHHGGMFGFGH
jgi:uncharacterized protein YidB (DUF937 family)